MDVTMVKQAKGKLTLSVLVSKRIQQRRAPLRLGAAGGRGGHEGQPTLWHVNFLFPPNQSAEVRMFYLSRHVSASV